MRDALNLVGVVNLGIDGALLAVAEIGDGLRLAEETPPVSSRRIMISSPSTASRLRILEGVGQRRIDDGGADIGE